MNGYDIFHECYKEDDDKKVKRLIERHSVPPALSVAAAYSTTRRKLSNRVARALIEAFLAEANTYYALWMFNDVINEGKRTEVERDIMKLVYEAIPTQSEPNNPEANANRKKLIQYIGTCAEPEFDRFLSFISRTISTMMALTDDVNLVILERIRRRLKDDRAFFLVLHSGFMTSAFEALINQVHSAKDVVARQLQEQGCELEEIPGTGAFIVRPPTKSGSQASDARYGNSATEHDAYNPNSGTAWVAQHPRRNRNRHKR